MNKKTLAIGIVLALSDVTAGHAYFGGPICPSGPYSVEISDGAGMRLPAYEHGGRTYVLGRKGARYQIRVRNDSDRRVESVISVDGRDVLDGEPANLRKRGYVIDPHGEVLVDGFRLDLGSVAAFRFSSVRDSYAAQMGNALDVGVIGVAIFPERVTRPRRIAYPDQRREGRPGILDDGSNSGAAPSGADTESAPAAPSAEGRGDTRSEQARVLAPSERPGLGTQFGEQRSSPVSEVAFQRARPNHPDQLLTVRYNDRQGLEALGICLDPARQAVEDDVRLREDAHPFLDTPREFSEPPAGWRP